MNEVPEVFPAYRLVAEFADGQRLTFDGLTEQQAQGRMEAAQAQHGDICWYDGVTDQHYETEILQARPAAAGDHRDRPDRLPGRAGKED